ncbi:MAG: APC family permease [Parvularculaceae bacterium]|nr:APC family permease [Parvularculaceae bacterium]
MLVLNGAVGAGIFALPATLDALAGPAAAFFFPLFALGVFAIAAPLAALARRFDQSGGPAAYVGAAFGPFAGFQAGWIYWAARAAAFAANSVVFATYAASLFPMFAEGPARLALLLAVAASVTALNLVGLKTAVRAQGLVTLLKLAPLFVISLAAIAAASGAAPHFSPPTFSATEQASLLVLYAFVGFEQALVPAGETRNPGRTLPRALFLTLGATTLLYFLVQLGYSLAMAGEAKPDAPLVALGEKLLGPFGAYLLLAAALFSLAGNLLSIATTAPRLTHAFGETGLLPVWFAATHPTWRTPHHSILFFGALAAALALSGGFVFLAVMSTLARLVIYLASMAALVVLRRRDGPLAPRLGAGLWLATGGGAAFCVWALSQSKAEAWATLAALAVAGAVLFSAARRRPEARP